MDHVSTAGGAYHRKKESFPFQRLCHFGRGQIKLLRDIIHLYRLCRQAQRRAASEEGVHEREPWEQPQHLQSGQHPHAQAEEGHNRRRRRCEVQPDRLGDLR